MTSEVERNRNKEPVTIRLDGDTRAELQAMAVAQRRTVSSLIDQAVRDLLDRELGRVGGTAGAEGLRVRYAMLPDTAILNAFHELGGERFTAAMEEAGLPELDFKPRAAEWRNLPLDAMSGKADIVEAVNRLPIYWHVQRGSSSPPLDWIGPFLQIFVGHCVFVRGDHLAEFLPEEELEAFREFASLARSGKDQSLRSLIAWAGQSEGDDRRRRVAALEEAWRQVIVGTLLGTDFHVAVRRVASALAEMLRANSDGLPVAPREPNPVGIDSLERGLDEFRSGTHSAFTGHLLQSAELFADPDADVFLLAGPADLKVPSLNTLTGPKGMFDFKGRSPAVGRGVLSLWREAVSWFRDEVVAARTDLLARFVETSFPDGPRSKEQIEILRSLMQSWVRWFEGPEEAWTFMDKQTEDLVKHYQDLGERLSPTASMPPPQSDPFWRFQSLTPPRGHRLASVA